MSTGRKHASVVVNCEPEWLARPLTDLINHVTHNYSMLVAQRLNRITATTDQTRHAAAGVPGRSEQGTAFAVRLSSLVTTLRLVLEAHAWSEGDVLFPAVVSIEAGARQSAPFRRDAIDILVEGIAEEHDLIREFLASVARTMEECVASGLSPELESFVADLEVICFLVAEQLDLEDRCLWPRMRELFEH
jgi:iron-sulfur cluster repair protein YtfE (RIC family)